MFVSIEEKSHEKSDRQPITALEGLMLHYKVRGTKRGEEGKEKKRWTGREIREVMGESEI